MKRIIYTLALVVALSSYGYGFTRTIDEGIETISDVADSAITVSSAPWTQLISSKLLNRDGVIVNVPGINTGTLYIHISSVTNAPSISTNTVIIEIKPTDTERVILIDDDLTMFGITTHTGEETIYLQQFRQVE